MLVAILLSLGLAAWSLIANLVIGDTLYVTRNLLLTALLIWLARANGVTWSGLGLSRERLAAGLRWGGATALVVLVAIVIGVMVGDRIPIVASLLADERAQVSGGELVHNVLVRIPLGTAVFEEVAFRGVLLTSLLAVTSTWRAVAWSSLVFGLWHVAPTIVALRINDVAPASSAGLRAIVAAVVVTTVAGVLFGALRVVSGSLVAPMIGHWATNGIGLVAASMAGDAS